MTISNLRLLKLTRPPGRAALAAVVLGLVLGCSAFAQQLPWSQRVANSTIQRWPDGRFVAPGTNWTWNYELGILLNGMEAAWYNSADGAYYQYS